MQAKAPVSWREAEVSLRVDAFWARAFFDDRRSPGCGLLAGVQESPHIGRVRATFAAVVAARPMTQELRGPGFMFDFTNERFAVHHVD